MHTIQRRESKMEYISSGLLGRSWFSSITCSNTVVLFFVAMVGGAREVHSLKYTSMLR